MSMPDLTVQALALTIRHLKQFGFERILCLGASFRPFSSKMEMTFSANALQQLEVIAYFCYAEGFLITLVSCAEPASCLAPLPPRDFQND